MLMSRNILFGLTKFQDNSSDLKKKKLKINFAIYWRYVHPYLLNLTNFDASVLWESQVATTHAAGKSIISF